MRSFLQDFGKKKFFSAWYNLLKTAYDSVLQIRSVTSYLCNYKGSSASNKLFSTGFRNTEGKALNYFPELYKNTLILLLGSCWGFYMRVTERGGEESTFEKGLIEELQISMRGWQQPVCELCLFPRIAQLLLLDSRTSKLFLTHRQLSAPI